MEVKSASLDIPFPYGKLFERYEAFNELQSALLEDLLHSDKSVVLSAPTGSGKTVAFELAIVRMLQVATAQQQQQPAATSPKAIYVAPIKALCAEKFLDWKTRFEALPIQVVQITGDSDVTDLAVLRGVAAPPQLVITTPEKWDSLTRRWRECNDVMSTVRLFMVDEVHLLNEDVRGPILEAVVSRMKTIAAGVAALQCNGEGSVGGERVAPRFVVASATIPNIEDLCLWLNNGSGSSDVVQFAFTDMQRPVPLEILGVNSKLKGFQFDISLNYKLPEVLRKYSERKPTLIFCNSRKSAEMATAVLAKEATSIFPLKEHQKVFLEQLAARLHDNKLRKVLAYGIAFHHAGMTYEDRSLVEDSFRKGFLMVVLSTNTLAMGVNLPAHLVVIKSTESYCRGSLEEYTESTLLQMIGRAGRPQYDTKGIAVILTHSRSVHKYENLMQGKMPVESHLHKHLAEHLNVEIALGTINNLEVAMNWMRSTYLYVRCVRNPTHYGMDAYMDRDFVEKKLQEMCLVQINTLHDAGLVKMSNANGSELQTTPYGKLMAKYYLCFETMKLFRQVQGTETLLEVLNLIVRCKEFDEFTVRVNEKKTLNELNASPIRFPVKGRIKTREDKISCLIQAVLGNLQITLPGLAQESIKMLRIGDRVTKCLLEYMRLSERQLKAFPSGCYKALLHALTIAKSFHAKLWENSEFASKQLRKIGAVYSGLLANAGKSTLKSIAETDARTIELILNKSAPFGDEVLQNLLSFPEYELQVNLKSKDSLQIYVRQVNEEYVYNGASAVLIVGDSANNLLCCIDNLDSELHEHNESCERTVKVPDATVEYIKAHVIHTTLVGVDICTTFILNKPAEDSAESSNKKAAKRKRQSKLNVSRIKKKKPDANNNNTDEDNNNNYNVDVCVPTNQSFSFSLAHFNFSKPKLQNLRSTRSTEAANTLPFNQPTINIIKNNAQAEKSEQSFKSADNSMWIQKKVTEFFSKRKYVTPTTANPNELKDAGDKIDNRFEASQRHTTESDKVILQEMATVQMEASPLLKIMPDCTATRQTEEPMDLSRNKTVEKCAQHNSVFGNVAAETCVSSNPSQYNINWNNSLLDFPSKASTIAGENANVLAFDLSMNMSTNSVAFLETSAKPAIFSLSPEKCVAEQTFQLWYKVAIEFSKLQPQAQTFVNFKALYHNVSANKPLQLSSSKTLRSIGTSPIKRKHSQISSHISGALQTSCMTSKPRPSHRTTNNPFRLQLYKDDESALLSRSRVNSINQSVMSVVFNMKCQDTQDSLDIASDTLSNIEQQLLLQPKENDAPELTFDDYCRLYLNTTLN